MASAPRAPESTERFKYRIRFAKSGDLRLVSHHDLMHCCERLFRRAQVPIAVTQGFHPSPRMSFALSLALGVIGSNEVLEIELTQNMLDEALLERLRRHAPPGLLFHSVRAIPWQIKAQPRRALYRLQLPRAFQDQDDLARRCEGLLAQPELWVERLRPEPRSVNLRPFLAELLVRGTFALGPYLELSFWVTPSGTARPEEVLRLLGLEHLLDEVLLERVSLEVADEVGPDAPPPPVIEPGSLSKKIDKPKMAPPVRAAGEQPVSLMQGPLSFDS